mmetsp:Transcript_36360/g.120415  ORF Transcript_36360/g.120415 Transcript_36360/m.120415 type:complete len:252 (-) Transcript_36360:107-862(-)
MRDEALDRRRATALRADAERVPWPHHQLRRRGALGDDLREGVALMDTSDARRLRDQLEAGRARVARRVDEHELLLPHLGPLAARRDHAHQPILPALDHFELAPVAVRDDGAGLERHARCGGSWRLCTRQARRSCRRIRFPRRSLRRLGGCLLQLAERQARPLLRRERCVQLLGRRLRPREPQPLHRCNEPLLARRRQIGCLASRRGRHCGVGLRCCKIGGLQRQRLALTLHSHALTALNCVECADDNRYAR